MNMQALKRFECFLMIIIIYAKTVFLVQDETTTTFNESIANSDHVHDKSDAEKIFKESITTTVPTQKTTLNNKTERIKSSTSDIEHFKVMKNEFGKLKDWSRLCKLKNVTNNTIKILCTISHGLSLRLDSFRHFTSHVPFQVSFDVEIRCIGGHLSFPWPFRAEKLSRIYINNCTIKDYLTEFKANKINEISDTLKYLHIEYNKIVLRVAELYNSFSMENSSVVRAAECGPENAIVIIRRNMKFEFEDIENFNFNSEYDFSYYFNIQKKTCLYKDLKVFEVSGTEYLEKNTVNKIVNTDEAPNLRILNFSRCGVRDTLYKLQGWRLRFPFMEWLDLSHNKIQDIPQIRDFGKTVSENSSVGCIDLRYNNISTITKDMISSFATHRTVKVDIRHNPFRCDCGTIDVVKYMKRTDMPAMYDYLESLKCYWPETVKGKTISSLKTNYFNCSKQTFIIIPAIVLIVIVLILFIYTATLIYFKHFITNRCKTIVN